MEIFTAFCVFAAICVSGGVGFYLNKHLNAKRIGDATELATRIVEESRKEAQAQKKEILLQGQDELFNQKRELEHEFKERERELKARDRKLQEQGERLEEKLEKATEKEHELLSVEKDLAKKERRLAELEESLNEHIAEQERRLQEVSGLTAEEARQRLFAEIESRTRHEAAKMMRLIEAEARETADRKAKEIIASSIQRYAGDYVSEHTVTAVTLPNEEMKGRIIGREGPQHPGASRRLTGVDLIIDDTPEAVIAVQPTSRLRRRGGAYGPGAASLQDGRIHPARIEDVVHKCEQELEVQIREVGEQATFDAGVHGIHPELVRYLGQLRYRTSFTQNVLQHSLEGRRALRHDGRRAGDGHPEGEAGRAPARHRQGRGPRGRGPARARQEGPISPRSTTRARTSSTPSPPTMRIIAPRNRAGRARAGRRLPFRGPARRAQGTPGELRQASGRP